MPVQSHSQLCRIFTQMQNILGRGLDNRLPYGEVPLTREEARKAARLDSAQSLLDARFLKSTTNRNQPIYEPDVNKLGKLLRQNTEDNFVIHNIRNSLPNKYKNAAYMNPLPYIQKDRRNIMLGAAGVGALTGGGLYIANNIRRNKDVESE